MDFLAFWEFFNPFEDEEKDLECPVCRKEFNKTNKIEVLDKEEKTFKCSNCNSVLKLVPNTGKLEKVEEKFKE